MLPSLSWILAEAINAKILTKNHSDSHIPTLIPHIPTPSPAFPPWFPAFPHSNIPTPIPRIPTLIFHIPTLIPLVPTLILHVPIILLIPLPDSPFQVLQIALFMTFISLGL